MIQGCHKHCLILLNVLLASIEFYLKRVCSDILIGFEYEKSLNTFLEIRDTTVYTHMGRKHKQIQD